MLRFNTAFISNAAHRTFATSALLLRLHATDIDAPVENKQSKDCLAELEAALAVKNGEAVAVDLRALRNELVAHRAETAQLHKQCRALQLRLPIDIRTHQQRSYDLIAEALELVDSEFQRRFKTPFSLVTIWRTPIERRDEIAENVLKIFLEENEKRIPRTSRSHFFSAWDRIRLHTNFFPQRGEEARTLDRHVVEDALVMCCGEWDEELRAILLEVIMSYGARKR